MKTCGVHLCADVCPRSPKVEEGDPVEIGGKKVFEVFRGCDIEQAEKKKKRGEGELVEGEDSRGGSLTWQAWWMAK